MGRAFVLACVLAGCGRIAFDERSNRSDGGADTQIADAGPDGVLTPGMIQRWQQGTVVNATGPSTVSLSTPSMPGSTLVLVLAVNDASTLALPNGWTIAGTIGQNGACAVVIAYLANAPSTTSLSYTMGALAPNVGQLIELTGASQTAPLDAVGQATSGNGVFSQTVSTSMSTTGATDVAITVFCEDASMPTYTPDPAWVRVGTYTNTSATPSMEADSRVVTPGVATETITSSVKGKYAAVIAAFK